MYIYECTIYIKINKFNAILILLNSQEMVNSKNYLQLK